MSVTCDVSQPLMSPLKDVAPLNIGLMNVRCDLVKGVKAVKGHIRNTTAGQLCFPERRSL